jgi:predicted phage terminase large subunit-like protein
LLRDPASEKKRSSDYTVDIVVGLGKDKNYYIIDIERSRLNLTERTNQLFSLHEEYEPLEVGYEQYGMQADIEHVEEKQKEMNYRFNITKVGGSMPKNDRIKRLIPLFEQGRVFFPKRLLKTDERGIKRDIVKEFTDDEYLAFPVGVHDDMLDCLARIFDINTTFPKAKKKVQTAPPASGGWMGM